MTPRTRSLYRNGLGLGIVLLIGLTTWANASDWKAEVDAAVQTQIDAERIVGTVIGVIKDGEIWTRSYGRLRTDDPSPPSLDTIFELGSVTKVFTGLALGQLLIDGRLSLDNRIEQHVPELTGLPSGGITLRELTSHTSGLPRLPTNLVPSDPLNPYKDYRLPHLIDFLRHFRFAHPGPFAVEYSNLGVGLLGYALSKFYGADYDRMIRTLITNPLEMKDTGTILSASQLQRTAQGYDSTMEENPLWDMSILAGAGSIRASLQDMLRFLAANLNPETSSLTSAIQLSHQIQVSGPEDTLGLGWFIDGTGDQTRISHNGQTGGFHSLIAFKPAEKTGLVVLTNTAANIPCLSHVVFETPCEPKPAEFAHTEPQLQSYLGEYEFEPGFSVKITRKRLFLVAQMTNQSRVRLNALSKERFDYGNGSAEFKFFADSAGLIYRLIVTQNGTAHTANKIDRL